MKACGIPQGWIEGEKRVAVSAFLSSEEAQRVMTWDKPGDLPRGYSPPRQGASMRSCLVTGSFRELYPRVVILGSLVRPSLSIQIMIFEGFQIISIFNLQY